MEKGSPAQIAMENAMHIPEFVTLATNEKYQRCLQAIQATALKKIGIIKLKRLFKNEQQAANETEKEWYTTKINEYNILHCTDPHYIKSIQERVAIYITSLMHCLCSIAKK